MVSVSILGLSKHYGPVWAVDDLSLEVAAGELLALPSKCGAEPFMSAIFGARTQARKIVGPAEATPVRSGRGAHLDSVGGPGVPLSRFGLAVFAITVLLFLSLPIVIIVPMSFSSASSLAFPPPGLSLRWCTSFFGDPRRLRAAWTSVLVAFASSGAALLLGGMAAHGLARTRFPGRALVEGNFLLPSILPPIITAVAL